MTKPEVEAAEIELYGANTGNCLRVSIALEEACLRYRVRLLDLKNGEQRGASHRSINPAGQVPTIIRRAPGEPAFVLSQSNAILFYIAELVPGSLLPLFDLAARARTFERFFFFLTDVIGPSHAAFALRQAGTADSVAYLDTRSMTALGRAESYLAESRFVAGDNFTLADIAAFTITLAYKRYMDWGSLPRLSQWYEQVASRPAVERGLRAFREP